MLEKETELNIIDFSDCVDSAIVILSDLKNMPQKTMEINNESYVEVLICENCKPLFESLGFKVFEIKERSSHHLCRIFSTETTTYYLNVKDIDKFKLKSDQIFRLLSPLSMMMSSHMKSIERDIESVNNAIDKIADTTKNMKEDFKTYIEVVKFDLNSVN